MSIIQTILTAKIALSRANVAMGMAEFRMKIGRGNLDECLACYQRVLMVKIMICQLERQKHEADMASVDETPRAIVQYALSKQCDEDLSRQRAEDERAANMIWPDLAAGVDTVFILPKGLLHVQN